MDIQTLNTAQRMFFRSGATRSLAFRLAQLTQLEKMILENEPALLAALQADLGKNATEAKLTDIHIVLDEIRYLRKNLWKWLKPKTVKTPFPALWRGRSTIRQQPYGVTLIIAPWNFPIQLSLAPLAGAIAGGNCAVLKPSPLAHHSHALLNKLINTYFPEHYIQALDIPDAECDNMLKQHWDYVFFTGSPKIGKHILAQLAPHLTPATLELGGKSPCIIDETADLKQAAQQIIWAKFLNAGQVCIAPDFLVVHESVHDALVQALIETLHTYFGDDPAKSPDYGRIINDTHFQRLLHLLENASVVHGGRFHEKNRYIEPTLLDHVRWSDAIMQEEIFGPLLPILTYDDLESLTENLQHMPSPLALYIFTKQKPIIGQIHSLVPFGSAAINTCILQYTNHNLPFGGVGNSGMGRYHGRYSFETFTYAQSCYERFRFPNITLHHPPFTAFKKRWLMRLLGY